MKKLTTQFVLDHIDEQFMIGINALYWTGSLRSSMTNVLEEGEFPTFSESFYRRYGAFSPRNPDIAIRDIQEEKCSIRYLDSSIKWGDFVIDVIGFFHHSKCIHDMKKIIKEKFVDHYEYTASVSDEQQEAVAKKALDDYNDARMLTLFEFRDYMWGWDTETEQAMSSEDEDDHGRTQSHPDDGAVAGPSWA
jgi:hypothetical protein